MDKTPTTDTHTHLANDSRVAVLFLTKDRQDDLQDQAGATPFQQEQQGIQGGNKILEGGGTLVQIV